MSRFFRSVGTRLSLALLLVVAIALGVVYLAVVPSLEKRLVNTRISQLEVAARKLAPRAAKQTQVIPQDFVVKASRDTGARVMIFAVDPGPSVNAPFAESNLGQNSQDVENDPIATRAAKSGGLESGTVSDEDGRWAEAAIPFTGGMFVLLLRDSLAAVVLAGRLPGAHGRRGAR